MVPLLSTRLFGRVPAPADLALVRRVTFFELALWLQDLLGHPRESRVLGDAARDMGINVPACHLPIQSDGRPLDLHGSLIRRVAALDVLRRSLDLAQGLGTHVCVTHVPASAPDDAVWHLVEAAEERGLSLAFEADTVPHTSLAELERLLAEIGDRHHGLCIDLSRTAMSRRRLREVQSRLPVEEVSSRRPGQPHGVPFESDGALRAQVQLSEPVPFLVYEVLSDSLPVPPGEAEVTMLLRRVSAWHRGDARLPLYEGAGASI